MAGSEDKFLVRAPSDVTFDGEVWGIEVNQSDGGKQTYMIAGADGKAEAERRTNEQARVSAEAERRGHEEARIAAEDARIAAEDARAAEDAKRTAKLVETTARADASASAAGEAASKANAVLGQLPLPDGNIPRGHASGEVASADDAFSAAMLGLTMYGVTKRNLWVNPTGTVQGITVSSNPDGSMSVKGAAVGQSVIATATFALSPGKLYKIACNRALSDNFDADNKVGCALYCEFFSSNTLISSFTIGTQAGLSCTFTFPANADKFTMAVLTHIGTDVDLDNLRVLVTEADGGQAEWSRPGLSAAEPETVIASGGNLLDLSRFTARNANVRHEGGRLVCTGANGWAGSLVMFDRVFAPGRYSVRLGNCYRMVCTESFIPNGKLNKTYAGYGYPYYTENSNEVQTFDADRPFKVGFVLKQGDTTVSPHVEVGASAGGYAPFEGSETAIDLKSNALRSLPDGTRDELRIDGSGKVTLVQRVAMARLDGSGAWSKGSGGSGYNHYFSRLLEDKAVGNQPALLADAYRCAHYKSGPKNGEFYIADYGKQIYMKDPWFAETVEQFKDQLSKMPATVLYPLAEPKTIDLGSIAMPKLPQGTAHVWTESEVAPELDAEYIRDINIVIKRLEQAIVASASNL